MQSISIGWQRAQGCINNKWQQCKIHELSVCFIKTWWYRSVYKLPVGYTAALSSDRMFLLLTLLISMLCSFFAPVNNTITSFKILHGWQTQQSLLLIFKWIYITCIKRFPIFIANIQFRLRVHYFWVTINTERTKNKPNMNKAKEIHPDTFIFKDFNVI